MKWFLRMTAEMISRWLHGDRIRVAPTRGRLLGLQLGDRIVVRGEAYRVRSRIRRGGRIIYEIDDGRGQCELVVPIPTDHNANHRDSDPAKLHRGQAVECVFDEDVAMIGRRRRDLCREFNSSEGWDESEADRFR